MTNFYMDLHVDEYQQGAEFAVRAPSDYYLVQWV